MILPNITVTMVYAYLINTSLDLVLPNNFSFSQTAYRSQWLVLSNKWKLTLSIFLLLIVSVCVFFCEYKNETKAQLYNDTSLERNKKVVFGAWVPFQLQLESMQGTKQVNAIHSLLSQEFDEYYFVMRNFNNSTETKAVEALLKLTDPTDLKIFIILLPPSEGGINASYDWKGWMLYFNSLKEKHPSFQGFAVDDFNAFVDLRRIYLNNLDLMERSNFSSALSYKSNDVQFYPVMYFEAGGFETLKKEYNKYTEGIILVSTLFHNISHFENDFVNLRKVLDNKSIKFIVYPIKSGFDPPSDRLIMATLSIASRWVDGIIIYVNTNHPIVQDYIHNHKDPLYMSAIGEMERLQVKNEIVESRRDIRYGLIQILP